MNHREMLLAAGKAAVDRLFAANPDPAPGEGVTTEEIAEALLTALTTGPVFDKIVMVADASLHPRSPASAWRLGKMRTALRAALGADHG